MYKDVIQDINSKFYIPDILERERGDHIPSCDFTTNCVSHIDSKPSLRVYIERGRHAYCFSCGRSYTPYTVVKYLKGYSYSQIVDYFVDVFGYQLSVVSFEDNFKTCEDEELSSLLVSIQPYLMKKNIISLLDKVLYVCYSKGDLSILKELKNKIKVKSV